MSIFFEGISNWTTMFPLPQFIFLPIKLWLYYNHQSILNPILQFTLNFDRTINIRVSSIINPLINVRLWCNLNVRTNYNYLKLIHHFQTLSSLWDTNGWLMKANYKVSKQHTQMETSKTFEGYLGYQLQKLWLNIKTFWKKEFPLEKETSLRKETFWSIFVPIIVHGSHSFYTIQ